MRALGGALLAGAILLAPVTGWGQDVDPRAEFQRGQTAYQQGDYDGAIAAWQRAYDADPQPLLLYNLSQAYERLGRLTEAVDALDRYLAGAAPDDRHQADARARVAALRERLARTGVVVRGAPDGAEISVDGQSWGRTPRPDAIRVEPGSHRVVVTLDGYEDFNSTVVVPAGQTVEVEAAMEASTTVPGTTTPGATTSYVSSGTSSDGGDVFLPIALMGAGGALVITGSIVGVVALGTAQDAPSSEGDEADSARALALVSDLCLAAGVVAAGVGVALLVLGSRGTEEGPPEPQPAVLVDVAPAVGPGFAGASMQGSF